ncbi:MAG: ABC transporter permease [Planctomycetes bacterium]|nr:ABC transporter permease [Planctomycetota bacterium]
MSTSAQTRPNRIAAAVGYMGATVIDTLAYIGGITYLALDLIVWVARALLTRKIRFGREALYIQLVRVGVRSIGIIVLVSMCIGLILVLQMAPPLKDFGQVDKVANVNAVAIIRELGPLISAIVLTGFAGASMAAELGTMVVGEEIEALESMALNPVRFLVVPRVLATIVGLTVLAVFADLVAIGAGAFVGIVLLDIPAGVFQANTLEQAKLIDFITGLLKAGVFGMLIGLIACYNGLQVTGGAAGVGRATTITVVHAIVSIIIADLLFTALFYALGWT